MSTTIINNKYINYLPYYCYRNIDIKKEIKVTEDYYFQFWWMDKNIQYFTNASYVNNTNLWHSSCNNNKNVGDLVESIDMKK